MDGENKNRVGISLAMPDGGILEIRSSKPIDEMEVGINEKTEGVIYKLYWNNELLPWHTETQFLAMAIASGCQWGALEMHRKIYQK